MKKKIYTRPVSVVLTEEIFNSIKEITDSWEISISDYIRVAIHEMLKKTNDKKEESNNEEKNIAYFHESSYGTGSLYTVESECSGEKGPDVRDYSRGNQYEIGSDG